MFLTSKCTILGVSGSVRLACYYKMSSSTSEKCSFKYSHDSCLNLFLLCPPSRTPSPPFKALVLAILTHPHTFTMIVPSTVHLSFLYPCHCSPWEVLFIIAAHLWFISPGMDANSSLRACFKELRMSATGPNLCSQTTRSVCRDAPFVFRAKQSSQWGASSSHLNSDSVSWFFFFFLLVLLLFLSLSLYLYLTLAVFLFPIQSYYLRGTEVLETHSLCFFPCWGGDEPSVWSQRSLCRD